MNEPTPRPGRIVGCPAYVVEHGATGGDSSSRDVGGRVRERPRRHREVWVKVNARVDEGVAEMVSLLAQLPGLETVESCQGEAGFRPAFVMFWRGRWREVAAFAFEVLDPILRRLGRIDYRVSVEVFNGSSPRGEFRFSAEAADQVASALREVIRARRFPCSCGRSRKAPRNSRGCPVHRRPYGGLPIFQR